MSATGRSAIVGVVGGSVSFSFTITNDDPKVIRNDINWIFTTPSGSTDITGSSINGYSFSMDLLSITIIGVSYSHEGNYTMMASNAAGSAQSTIALDVEGMAKWHCCLPFLFNLSV